MRLSRWSKIILGLIACGILFLIAFDFRTSPPSWFDEGIYHQIVANMAFHRALGMQLAPGVYSDFALISVGYSVFYPAVVFFWLFGGSIFVLRIVAVLFLLAFVAAFYLVARRLYGNKVSLWSLALLAAFSPLYGDGKNFLGEVPGLCYFMWSIWCLLRVEIAKRTWPLALLAGLLAGLAVSAKPIYLLLLPAFGLAFILQAKLFFKEYRGRIILAWFSAGAIITVMIWLITQFGFSHTPLLDIIHHYRNPNYVSDTHSDIMMNLKRFVTESTPIHFLLLSILAAAYFFTYAFRRLRIQTVELILLIFIILVTLSYIRTAGWYRYFFPAHVFLFLFLPRSLEFFGDMFAKKLPSARLALPVCCVGILLAQFVPLKQERLVHIVDAPTVFESILKQIPANKSVFFYNLPQIAARYSGSDYYQYVEMNPNLYFGDTNKTRLQSSDFDYVIIPDAVAENQEELLGHYDLVTDKQKVRMYMKK